MLLGNERARFSAQAAVGPAALLEYLPGAHVVTELMDFTGRATGPGIVFGTPRSLVLPYLFPDGPETGLLSLLRKQLFISLLTRLALAPEQISYCPDQAYLTVFRYDRPADIVVLFVNASTDEVGYPTVHLGGGSEGEAEVRVVRQLRCGIASHAEVPGRTRRPCR